MKKLFFVGLRLVITDGSYVGFYPDCYAFCV